MVRCVSVAVVFAFLATAAPAVAGQRYAAPTPSGKADCSTSSDACDIATAISGVKADDEVIVEPGDYGSETTPITSPLVASDVVPNVFIHGVDGAPRPRIHFGSGAYLFVRGSGDRVHYLDLEGGALDLEHSTQTADEIIDHTTSGQTACNLFGNLIDSVCWAEGTNANAFEQTAALTSTISLRNDTFVASGSGGKAVSMDAESGGKLTVLATNVIARATGPSGTDLDIETDGSPNTTATFTPDHSNFSTSFVFGTGASVTPSSTDQTQAPVFTNASLGDFHQASGSPTIDHGADDPANGTSDFEGDPRTLNGKTDIGADEFRAAPGAVSGPAIAVSANGATLTGSVDPRGLPATYRFVYGRTNAYGHTTPLKSAGSGTGAQPHSTAIAGLLPGRKYHYRIEATGAGGTTRGADRTFTTVDTFKGVVIHKQTVSVKNGSVRIKVACPALTPPPCHGKLTLKYRQTTVDALGQKHVKTRKLGSASFNVAAGHSKKVTIMLKSVALSLLQLHNPLKTKAHAKAADGAGTTKTRTAPIRLKQP